MMNDFFVYFKFITIYIFSFFYIGVGISHFISPEIFLIIMPPYLPFPLLLVYVSGFFEILFGLLLLFRRCRLLACVGIIILLLAVFPANIYLYNSDIAREAYGSISKNQAMIRMFFQPCLIIIAYWHSQLNYNITFSYFCSILSAITIVYFSAILF